MKDKIVEILGEINDKKCTKCKNNGNENCLYCSYGEDWEMRDEYKNEIAERIMELMDK